MILYRFSVHVSCIIEHPHQGEKAGALCSASSKQSSSSSDLCFWYRFSNYVHTTHKWHSRLVITLFHRTFSVEVRVRCRRTSRPSWTSGWSWRSSELGRASCSGSSPSRSGWAAGTPRRRFAARNRHIHESRRESLDNGNNHSVILSQVVKDSKNSVQIALLPKQ